MFYLYVLRSLVGNNWYIGSTKDINKRLLQHNSGSTRSTKPYRPWKVVYLEEYSTKSEACKREYYLKSSQGYLEYLKIKNRIIGEFA